MRKWIIFIAIAILVLGGGGWLVLQRQSARSAGNDQPTETAVVQRGDLSITVEAAGSLVPPVEVALAFKSAGRLAEVPAVKGQTVEAGDVLARLETKDLELQVVQAEATLVQAEAKLAQTAAGPRPEDIAAAEASLRLAQANYSKIAAGPSSEEVTMAGADLEKAAAAVERAQADYDKVAWRSDIAALPQSLTLQQATQDYEKAKAAYGLKVKGPSADDLAVVRAQVDQAVAQLEKIKNSLTAEELASAQAQVDQARAALEQARLRLADATLVAPMDGTVTNVLANPGEIVGAVLPLISLSALQPLQIEVNLDETDVARIASGAPVAITVDAFPGAELTGKVIDIAPSASIQSGVVLYPVTVRLNATDLPLRPGMTANATITVEKRENTLSEERVDAVANQITALLLRRHGFGPDEEGDFSVTTQADLLATVQQVTNILVVFLGAIAAISLLVGGIGIMNIMLVSVTERTREIGLRKAVGARKSDILVQLLLEAIVLSVIGGAIGIAVGVGIAKLVDASGVTQAVISSQSILLAVSFSVAVGLFFGIYPANRAASLHPIEALRYE